MKKLSVFLASLMVSGIAFAQVGAQPGQQDFDRLDADGDGNLSQEEMRAQTGGASFSEIDADADGEVTREEFQTFSASQPGQMPQDDLSSPDVDDTTEPGVGDPADPATTTP